MSLGIYIQVPFCQTKCTYCNFHAGPASRELYRPYAQAVAREIREHKALYKDQGLAAALRAAELPVDTIYLGGGTPSLFDPADLAKILDAVRAQFHCDWREVTLEADPETIRADGAAAWRAAGISRVSLGAQSFNDPELIATGRMHRRDEIARAVETLRASGISNVSLDLIIGLPQQTSESWERSVDEALKSRPEHISIYLLEIDEGSRLGKESLARGTRYGAATIPEDDAMATSYESACMRLGAAGYEHYEISNWALPGLASRHNLKYWRREAYLGFGAGAHSFAPAMLEDSAEATEKDGNEGTRWANAHDPAAYIAAMASGALLIEGPHGGETVTREQALEEELFLGLRELRGIDLPRIEKKYDVQLSSRMAALEAQGLIEREGAIVRLAPMRLAISNEVFVALLN